MEINRGYQIHLDADTGEGYMLMRDSAVFKQAAKVLAALIPAGWRQVDPDEAVEPHVFDDGEPGVKIWLYKEPDDQEVTLGAATPGR